ncbi:unnamed protein product [Ambrosiozyma monospora]|uniref:Unnamed protein product n=1 Tax=Ambrosiozyma monospora TaxID=43982 RepID=A0ACB5SYM1_AMBMO|nr:unnamed protein product [Ambrosiozyma monospora]
MTKKILKGLQLAEKLIDDNNYEEASKVARKALEEDPESFDALLINSEIDTKLKRYDSALTNAIKALIEAEAKDDKELIAKAYKQKSTSYFKLKCFYEALQQILFAEKISPDNSEIALYKSMIVNKYSKKSGKTKEEIAEIEKSIKEGYYQAPVSAKKKAKIEAAAKAAAKAAKPKAGPTPQVSSKPVPKIEEIHDEKPAPTKTKTAAAPKPAAAPAPKATPVAPTPKPIAKQNLRTDWFDTDNEVSIQVFVKFIQKESVKAEIKETLINFKFADKNKFEYEYSIPQLFSKVDVAKSSYRVFGTKLEITLVKATKEKWEKLSIADSSETEAEKQGEVFSYPTSGHRKIDWSEIEKEVGDEDDMDTDSPDYFFKKLYKDADPDTQRAMLKSYQESNGTALSTDWKDVSSKFYEPVPEDKYKDKDDK